MTEIKRINHIAIVVPSIKNALNFWHDVLGLRLDHIEEVTSQKSKVAFLSVGDSEVELVEPMGQDSGLSKFLAERGPGLHHLCFEVDDIGKMINLIKSKGVRLINEEPIKLPGRKMAFIHPKSAHGVLVELYQLIEP
jgi:methylmalonyl-CoA/ethylmalonyl-CoA epimerase